MPLAVIWPPPPRRNADPDALDDIPAARLLAAVIELARYEAKKGNSGARAWLEEWVEQPAAELLASDRLCGRVRAA